MNAYKFIFVLCVNIMILQNIYAQELKIKIGDVKDSRTTGEFFAGLDIELLFWGDDIENTKSFNCQILSAFDDTGRELLKEKEIPQFVDVDKDNAGKINYTVKLKNPSRKAVTIKELSGEIELYTPKNDPNAVVVIKNITSLSGKPLINNILKENNIRLSILTAEQYEAIKKKQKSVIDSSDVAGQFVSALSNLFGGLSEPGKNSLILQTVDPDIKVISIEFTDQSGRIISPTGTMSTDNIKIFDFDKPVSKNSQIKIYLKSQKAIKIIPFNLKDIDLP